MKRDMDLCRRILLWMESESETTAQVIRDCDSTDEVFFHQCWLLKDAGFILAADLKQQESRDPPQAYPLCLTWQGHEFLDASRDASRWQQAKGIIGKSGNWSFAMLTAVLHDLAMRAAAQSAGL